MLSLGKRTTGKQHVIFLHNTHLSIRFVFCFPCEHPNGFLPSALLCREIERLLKAPLAPAVRQRCLAILGNVEGKDQRLR